MATGDFDFTCRRCGSSDLSYFTTRRSNRNGNAGRPYYKCMPCDKFITFIDNRGIHFHNPECGCGHSSRLQVAGRFAPKLARGLHYVCATGSCDFFQSAADRSGRNYDVTEDLLPMLVGLSII